MKILGIIPARYDSTRFPGKPLIDIYGKPMIQRVYEQAKQSKKLSRLIVATDDKRIFNCVKAFGGEVIMTAKHHKNGTERCSELVKIIDEQYDVIINIQGDEPFFESDSIALLVKCFENQNTEIATLLKVIDQVADIENPSVVKAVISKKNKALYFSRHPIPFIRNKISIDKKIHQNTFYKHIGIYAYKAETLAKIVLLEESDLEKAESLEQLRWLENGYTIMTNISQHDSNSVDTPEDLKLLLNQFDANYFKD